MWRLIFWWEGPRSSWSSMIETSALRAAKAAGGKAESAAQRAPSARTAKKAGVRECLLLVKAIGPGARGATVKPRGAPKVAPFRGIGGALWQAPPRSAEHGRRYPGAVRATRRRGPTQTPA